MPIRRSPNGVVHPHPQTDRDLPERVIGINRNDCSRSIGTADRNAPVRARLLLQDRGIEAAAHLLDCGRSRFERLCSTRHG